MELQPINSRISPNFQGRLKVKGKWPNIDVFETFKSNPAVQSALENHSITTKIKTSYSKFRDEPLYRLSISACKDKPTLWDSIKYLFGFKPKANISKQYHSAYSTEKLIDSRIEDILKNKLHIEI